MPERDTGSDERSRYKDRIEHIRCILPDTYKFGELVASDDFLVNRTFTSSAYDINQPRRYEVALVISGIPFLMKVYKEPLGYEDPELIEEWHFFTTRKGEVVAITEVDGKYTLHLYSVNDIDDVDLNRPDPLSGSHTRMEFVEEEGESGSILSVYHKVSDEVSESGRDVAIERVYGNSPISVEKACYRYDRDGNKIAQAAVSEIFSEGGRISVGRVEVRNNGEYTLYKVDRPEQYFDKTQPGSFIDSVLREQEVNSDISTVIESFKYENMSSFANHDDGVYITYYASRNVIEYGAQTYHLGTSEILNFPDGGKLLMFDGLNVYIASDGVITDVDINNFTNERARAMKGPNIQVSVDTLREVLQLMDKVDPGRNTAFAGLPKTGDYIPPDHDTIFSMQSRVDRVIAKTNGKGYVRVYDEEESGVPIASFVQVDGQIYRQAVFLGLGHNVYARVKRYPDFDETAFYSVSDNGKRVMTHVIRYDYLAGGYDIYRIKMHNSNGLRVEEWEPLSEHSVGMFYVSFGVEGKKTEIMYLRPYDRVDQREEVVVTIFSDGRGEMHVIETNIPDGGNKSEIFTMLGQIASDPEQYIAQNIERQVSRSWTKPESGGIEMGYSSGANGGRIVERLAIRKRQDGNLSVDVQLADGREEEYEYTIIPEDPGYTIFRNEVGSNVMVEWIRVEADPLTGLIRNIEIITDDDDYGPFTGY